MAHNHTSPISVHCQACQAEKVHDANLDDIFANVNINWGV